MFSSLSSNFSLTMPSTMILMYGVPMFVGLCAILWMFWDRIKKPPKKKIFISADCWLCVFDLLEPSQLGLGIAMISHRFDYYVDEHFKTRKWTLKFIEIRSKIGENGTKEMEIVNDDGKALPIPQIQLPRKVTGFEHIRIIFIDQNAIAFLHRFRPLFAACPINLYINTTNDHILEFILHNIWPTIGKNIRFMGTDVFHRLRQFVPSILNDCPSLRVVSFYFADDVFSEFPCYDSAMASDGQAVAKWLFTPHPNNVPKVFSFSWGWDDETLTPRIETFKAAFANASFPVNFIVVIRDFWQSFADSVVPFDLTNELTREQLTLKRIDSKHFLLVRCPIVRDADKWAKWEKEAIDWDTYDQWTNDQWNTIDFDGVAIGDGLLNTTLGPIDQQQK